MARALYIGRFQPFHKGHLDVLKYMESATDIEEIIIGVGSSQYNNEHKSPDVPWSRNPFTYEERKEMIELSLDGELSKPYKIVPIPDYHHYPRWFNHIRTKLPDFAVLYTVDGEEKDFFSEKGYEVREFPRVYDFSARILRRKIVNGEMYTYALPKGTVEVMKKIGAEDRLKCLFAQDVAAII